jgi:C-terminal processing protease CtpA/Prc
MGIGVTVEIPGFAALIRKVLSDSPAERAGIRPGMKLRKINAREVPGWTLNLNDCMDLIRESASPVTLGIDPGDGKVYDVIIYKEPLSAPYP